MPSAEGKFFSRFWSCGSAGGLVCGKGLGQRKELSFEERNQEFNERHKRKFQDEPEPTALVSVSDKLVPGWGCYNGHLGHTSGVREVS